MKHTIRTITATLLLTALVGCADKTPPPPVKPGKNPVPTERR
jgi:hypothetical protein